MKNKIEHTYRKLNEVEHVLQRSGRYLGTIAPILHETYAIIDEKVSWGEYTYSPAFIKIFDEIISNSVDFSKRIEGKHLNVIKVDIDDITGQITVYDNGGIPVIKHSEYDQFIPDMIFGELRSGSNFDDNEKSIGTGQNGEGSTLTNIFSTRFTVDTADGHNRFLCTYHDNMTRKSVPVISKTKKSYTKISYMPDYNRFGITLDTHHKLMIVRRIHEIAATNTHLKVYINDKLIDFKNFADYVNLFSTNSISFGNDRLFVSVFHSKNGFKQIGFVNSTNVQEGGTHVDYIMGQIVSNVRSYIKDKTKQDIKPSDIKNHFFVMINATIDNPRYNSQTKEKLETQIKDYGTSLTIDKKTIQKIIKSDIVSEILAWAENKQKLEIMEALRRKSKLIDKTSLKHITKYEPATSKIRNNCSLFVTEGDSAAKALQSARDPRYHGIFPLKGKPLNVRGVKLNKLIENQEINDLMQILGLQYGKSSFPYELRYNRLIISTDQDLDGYHLCGLIINMFNELWPSLIKQNFLFKLQTPIVRVTQRKQEIDFMEMDEYKKWEEKQKKSFDANYLKGLGSNDTKYFKKYMFDEKYFIPITHENIEDSEALDIAFDKTKSNTRKTFIYGNNNEN